MDRALDLSFNRIAKIAGLDNLQALETLYLASNKIKCIENIQDLPELRVLEVGANEITVTIVERLTV